MSGQGSGPKPLSAAEYEALCREVRAAQGAHVTAEALLYALCKRVFHHLHGYGRDPTLPYAPGPRQEVYKATLARLVGAAQTEPFDALAVAGKYIPGC